jgi:hypothetical protein
MDMNWDRKALLVGVGVAVAIALGGMEAEAKQRGRRKGKKHRFKSAPAQTSEKTPARDSSGGEGSPVAGAPLDGGFRQEVVDGGIVLSMGPGRALVLNAYRGLTLVDTSDASAPRVLASSSIDGAGQRMFLGGDGVVVVSDARDAEGARTVVTSLRIGESSLSVLGSVGTAGSLRDAAREGADLMLVTSDGWYGPIYSMDAANGASPPMKDASGGFQTPGGGWGGWGGGAAHVARVRIASDGTPSITGTMDVTGEVVADVVTGTEAVLAVQSGGGYYGGPILFDDSGNEGDPSGGSDGGTTTWFPPTTSLVHVVDDGNAAPTNAGSLELTGVNGVAALDRAGTILRALEYADSGEILATYDVSGGAPQALDSFALSEWPSSFSFSGGALVWTTTDWNYDFTPPENPVFDDGGIDAAFGTKSDRPNSATGQDGPTSALHVVDLRDPSHLAAGATLDLADGWVGGLVAVENGVVCTTYGYDEGKNDTDFLRVDLSNPASPSVVDRWTKDGYWSLGAHLGDLLLVNGGTSDPVTGAFDPETMLVDLSGGGFAAGGSIDAGSWTTTAARSGDLLGLASYDRLSLVDVSDVNAPQARGEVRLVVNVAGFAALDGTTGAALTTDYVGGKVEVRTVRLPEANALSPLDSVEIATGDAQMFAAAPYLYVVATDWSTGRASLTVVDASDPSNVEVRGSLDLASYPGQVFLKDGALLLLREAWTLFNDDGSRLRPLDDAFGKCPKSLYRAELGAVLDVVDLADPDAPRAARRVRLSWDSAGYAMLSGDSLFVSSYENVTRNADAGEQYAYMVREIDVSNPLAPRAKAPVDVPGTLVAATGAPHQILTADYRWSDEAGVTTSLCTVDLSLPWSERVLASRPLDGWPQTTTVAGGRAYVVVETWGDLLAAEQSSTASLLTYSLDGLTLESTTSRDSGAYGGEVHGGRLFLRTWGWTGDIDVYSLANPSAPQFVLSRGVAGISGEIAVVGDRAYAAGGMYGVTAFDLSQ